MATALKKADDFRVYLKDELETRCRANPRYSLRAFARDLKLSPPRLSNILNGRYGLSREAALQIARRLELNPVDQEWFCTLVEAQHSRSKSLREKAQKRLRESPITYRGMALDEFRIISDWQHFAILELCKCKDFVSSPAWIAKRLNIKLLEAKHSVERLVRLNLLENVNGRLRATGSNFANPQNQPSEAVRSFHRQILSKAGDGLTHQSLEEREFNSLVLAFDRREMMEAKKMIYEFQVAFDNRFGRSENYGQVYALALQFFSLTKTEDRVEGAKKE